MNKLRNNLQLFCRVCLGALRPPAETIYNIHLVPNLTKLILLYTTLHVDEDSDFYPKNLCQMCYDKLQDFQSFRNLALQSEEVLQKIVAAKDITDETAEAAAEDGKSSQNHSKLKNVNTEEDNNDKQRLLELELSKRIEKSINSEHFVLVRKKPKLGETNTDSKNDSSESKNRSQSLDEDTTSSSDPDSDFPSSSEDEDDFLDDNEDDDEDEVAETTVKSTSTADKTSRKPDRKSLNCPLCDKHVYKKVYLEAHIRAIHEGHNKPFLCKHCCKAFTRYRQLNEHVKSVHIKNQSFPCDYKDCSESFRCLTTLETHRKVSHGIKAPVRPFAVSLHKVPKARKTKRSRESGKEHLCPQCCKKYSSKRALSEHLKRHANIKEYKCKVCSVAKVTRTELKTHMRIHQPNAEKFKCSLCPQKFNHKNAIQRHVRVVHEGLRPFPCSFCPKRFGTRNSKMCHERLHTGERPFVCQICNKGFAQSEGLKSHMKNHDKSLRTHVCKFCQQRFITRKNLTDHEERHRGDKPHICEVCSRGFHIKEDMLKHRQTHTEETPISKKFIAHKKVAKEEVKDDADDKILPD